MRANRMLVKRTVPEFGHGHVAQGPAAGPSRPRTSLASCFPASQAALDKSGFAAPAWSPGPSWDRCPIPFLAIRAPHPAPRCYTECLWLIVMESSRAECHLLCATCPPAAADLAGTVQTNQVASIARDLREERRTPGTGLPREHGACTALGSAPAQIRPFVGYGQHQMKCRQKTAW